ncbi:MAG TPA: hypothetical protein VIK01_06395, partial [Polyangiaceae bacterium]
MTLWKRHVTEPALLSPVVTIDVMPADVPAEYAPAMVVACTQALPQGVCALASATPEGAQPDAVALVLWQGDRFLEVSVRVGQHGSQWVARRLSFAEGDSLADRFTARTLLRARWRERTAREGVATVALRGARRR